MAWILCMFTPLGTITLITPFLSGIRHLRPFPKGSTIAYTFGDTGNCFQYFYQRGTVAFFAETENHKLQLGTKLPTENSSHTSKTPSSILNSSGTHRAKLLPTRVALRA